MHHRPLFAPLLAVCLGACASAQPSAELRDARRTYSNVQASEANVYAPAEVMTARQALERAEKAYEDDAGSSREKSLAYVAKRKAEIAAARADIIKAQRQEAAAENRSVERQRALREQAERELESTQSDLASSRREIAMQADRLRQEREARMEAERRANHAVASLREVARVQEEARGTTITLDGAVLFASGQSQLLPIAEHKLHRVAEALKEVPEDKTILVEGHTDSRGTNEMNMQLSQERADSVRRYLVNQGVGADRIRAVGRGEEEPLARNDTPEGRANNRRVEIVIERTRGSAEAPSSSQDAGAKGAPSPTKPPPQR